MKICIAKMVLLSSLHLFLVIVLADEEIRSRNECLEAKCGENEPPIRFPFRLRDSRREQNCAYPGFDLSCTNSNKTSLELPNSTIKFLVTEINYKYSYISVYNPDKNCSFYDQCLRTLLNLSVSPFQFDPYLKGSTMFNCSSNVTCFDRGYPIPCLSGNGYSVHVGVSGSYYRELDACNCRKMFDFLSVPPEIVDPEHRFKLRWLEPNCGDCEAKGKSCRLKENGAQNETECFMEISGQQNKGSHGLKPQAVIGLTVASLVVALVALVALHVYADRIERGQRRANTLTLKDYKAMKPSRYTFADIKRLTNKFKERLGEGIYGTEFKGTLPNGILVVVRILNDNFEGSEEDFVNGAETICRIHHVNVVRLLGYCIEGSRRALVLEFVSDVSLDKYITSMPDGANRSLGWKTLHSIALGVAKGIEYLHQGCTNHQISHFDIKPHNILLGYNFKPKISDIGLAKLCSKDQSTVSVSTSRGALSHIAPEVISSESFGNVSHKSDVYSFGMLLLEMVGGKKKTSTVKEDLKEIYDILKEGNDLRIQIEDPGDTKIAKKLIIVGLWCIQWYPVDRPNMKSVIQMLKDEGKELTMPPNPFASTCQTKANRKTRAIRMTLELQAIDE